MNTLARIIGSGPAMSATALVGMVTVMRSPAMLQRVLRILLPLVAHATGTLLCGVFLQMLPAAVRGGASPNAVFPRTPAGFAVLLGLEQLLHWQHSPRAIPNGERRRWCTAAGVVHRPSWSTSAPHGPSWWAACSPAGARFAEISRS